MRKGDKLRLWSAMKEEGIVTGTNGELAQVKVRRSEACSGCGSQGVCHSLGGDVDMEVEAMNTAGGGVGDRVQLELPSSSVVKIAFLVYMIPVICLVAGAIAGTKLAPSLSLDPELSALGLAVFGFAAAFLVVRKIGQAMGAKKEYRPEIVKVLLRAP